MTLAEVESELKKKLLQVFKIGLLVNMYLLKNNQQETQKLNN